MKVDIDEMEVDVWLTDRVGVTYLPGILRYMQFSECYRKSVHIMPVVVHRRAIFGTDSSASRL